MREWWRDAVIYQIYPRSFQDDNGDGIGDLQGIIRRLPHVTDLGADAIWLSPIFPSPMDDMGYDVSEYCDIDPSFGTLADFDALIARAHELGLKVIIDQVLSHTSDKHRWFEESRVDRHNPKADWYIWADPLSDGSPPTNWHSVFGGPAWEWEPRRGQYYMHNFLISQPDLNFHNEAVQDAVLDTMRFWLDRGVDGFRLDTVNYYFHDQQLRNNPPKPLGHHSMSVELYGMQEHEFDKNRPENLRFLRRLRALTDEYPDRMMVGEVGQDGDRAVQLMAEYTDGPAMLHMCYSFDMLGDAYTAAHFRRTISRFQDAAPSGHPEWSFSNHDVVRHATRWAHHANDRETLARQACALLMSFEGTIGIYQGEELGQTETEMEYHELTDPQAIRYWPGNRGRDGCRTPMVWERDAPQGGFSSGTPWLPVKAPQLANAVDVQAGRQGSVLDSYRQTIRFRRVRRELREGRTVFLPMAEPILAFRREVEGAAITCIFNLSPHAMDVSIDGDAALAGPHAAQLETGRLHLPANGFAWLESQGAIGVAMDSHHRYEPAE